MRIGVISDTHGWVDPAVYEHFAGVDEIWHAGDAGNIDVITELESFRPLKAVWGNCDDFRVRSATKGVPQFHGRQERVFSSFTLVVIPAVIHPGRWS